VQRAFGFGQGEPGFVGDQARYDLIGLDPLAFEHEHLGDDAVGQRGNCRGERVGLNPPGGLDYDFAGGLHAGLKYDRRHAHGRSGPERAPCGHQQRGGGYAENCPR